MECVVVVDDAGKTCCIVDTFQGRMSSSSSTEFPSAKVGIIRTTESGDKSRGQVKGNDPIWIYSP